jgi:hypothetical protein
MDCAFLNYKSSPSRFNADFIDSNMSKVRVGEREREVSGITVYA